MDTTPHASEPTAQSPVTPGHRRSLALLQQTDELTQAINIYRQALGGIEVYLRPTDRGLTVIPLHLGTPKFIGAGSINSLPVDADEVAGHVDEFHKKLAGARGAKPEEQFSL
ncbi:MAG TPA: hypothetical protein ENI86_00985, partial [Acidimicrobiales bacterium]|nr:hypothetical protein [Acidimicrobiales bacterium]